MPTKTTSSPSAQPPRHYINVLGQLLKYIPQGIVQAAAREHGVDAPGPHLLCLGFQIATQIKKEKAKKANGFTALAGARGR